MSWIRLERTPQHGSTTTSEPPRVVRKPTALREDRSDVQVEAEGSASRPKWVVCRAILRCGEGVGAEPPTWPLPGFRPENPTTGNLRNQRSQVESCWALCSLTLPGAFKKAAGSTSFPKSIPLRTPTCNNSVAGCPNRRDKPARPSILRSGAPHVCRPGRPCC